MCKYLKINGEIVFDIFIVCHYAIPIAMGLQNKKKIGFSRLKFKKVCLRAHLAHEEETQRAGMKIKLPILVFNE